MSAKGQILLQVLQADPRFQSASSGRARPHRGGAEPAQQPDRRRLRRRARLPAVLYRGRHAGRAPSAIISPASRRRPAAASRSASTARRSRGPASLPPLHARPAAGGAAACRAGRGLSAAGRDAPAAVCGKMRAASWPSAGKQTEEATDMSVSRMKNLIILVLSICAACLLAVAVPNRLADARAAPDARGAQDALRELRAAHRARRAAAQPDALQRRAFRERRADGRAGPARPEAAAQPDGGDRFESEYTSGARHADAHAHGRLFPPC